MFKRVFQPLMDYFSGPMTSEHIILISLWLIILCSLTFSGCANPITGVDTRVLIDQTQEFRVYDDSSVDRHKVTGEWVLDIILTRYHEPVDICTASPPYLVTVTFDNGEQWSRHSTTRTWFKTD